jgi:hypothetical protein
VTVPRLVIVIAVEGGPARAHLENVKTAADARRLRRELEQWPVRAEVRRALIDGRRELTRIARTEARR